MKSLYENIMQSRFPDRKVEESILSKSNVGILPRVIDNLTYCNDVTVFSKLWTMLKLDIDGCHWGYASGGGYVYKDLNGVNHIFCMSTTDPKTHPCMFIYVNLENLPEKFDLGKYVKLVTKTLNMTYEYKNAWYSLKFNK